MNISDEKLFSMQPWQLDLLWNTFVIQSCVACEDLMTTFLLFTDKLFVFKYCFIFIVLGSDTSSLGSRGWQKRSSRPSVKGRILHVWSEQWGN
jgi:hypothetical protein